MIIKICAFTQKGTETAERIVAALPEHIVEKREADIILKEWTAEAFAMHYPLVFVGACGIAVRTIAPYVADKLNDSPVLVIDEAAQHVIPILSGHMGGANELAELLADRLGAEAVLTTASDLNHLFAVDVFAKQNGLMITERKGIQRVTSKLLETGKVTLWADASIELNEKSMPGEVVRISKQQGMEQADIVITSAKKESACGLQLIPKEYIIGIGCKKDTQMAKIAAAIEDLLEKLSIDRTEVMCLASIDVKAKEYGLLQYASLQHLPFVTYTATTLLQVEGKFSESAFVQSKVGVSNVCERAAMCCAGVNAELIAKKQVYEGVTLAVAKRKVSIKWEK